MEEISQLTCLQVSLSKRPNLSSMRSTLPVLVMESATAAMVQMRMLLAITMKVSDCLCACVLANANEVFEVPEFSDAVSMSQRLGTSWPVSSHVTGPTRTWIRSQPQSAATLARKKANKGERSDKTRLKTWLKLGNTGSLGRRQNQRLQQRCLTDFQPLQYFVFMSPIKTATKCYDDGRQNTLCKRALF